MKKKASNQFFVPHNTLEEIKFLSMKYSSQILYIHLCRLDNRLGHGFWRSIGQLVKDTDMNEKTLKSAKNELLQKRYIEVERDHYVHGGFRSADRYFLNGYRYKDS